MLRETYSYFLAGEAVAANTDLAVTNKFTGDIAAHVAQADADAIDQAIAAAVAARAAAAAMPAYKRRAVLQHIVDAITKRADEFAHVLAVEAGKPIKDARGEVTRSIDTFRIAAEESVRILGEHMPLDISERGAAYQAIWRRKPIGPCSFIAPFNFPLNLVAHKVAPAIAAGCPFVLKPASKTPISALLLAEILAETEWPKGAFSVLPCTRDAAAAFTEDDRLKLLSFTGSDEVGWKLKAKAGRKKVVMELGGNAACIVHNDIDMEDVVDRVTTGAFYQSGQSCIGVQRVYAHRDVYEALRDALVVRARELKMGDPLDEETFVGPMIDESEAKRVEEWVAEAVEAGATVLCGGKREGVMYPATILEGAPKEAKVMAEEIFGPVFCMIPYDDFAEVIVAANDSRYGLQVGVFTRDLHRAFYAFEHLDVGGVVINDVPSMRVDSMPYGGVKDSGLGREGIRFAIEDMTEIRAMILRKAEVL